MRIGSVLPATLEELTHRIIGCGLAVHRELGAGFLEVVYQRALCLELAEQKIQSDMERSVQVKYRDRVLATHRIDLIVEGMVVVEVKASRRVEPVHEAQLISYLKATGLQVGLLMNFNVALFREGLKRMVL